MSNPGQLSRDYFESILEAVLLVEERSARIANPEDFVVSPEGTLILDSIAMRLQVIGELVKKIEKADPDILNHHKDIEWAMIMRLRDITLIKKGASIGSNATILCGITIGANSIIGAGSSVVTKDIPDNTIAAGNPARIIRKIESRSIP